MNKKLLSFILIGMWSSFAFSAEDPKSDIFDVPKVVAVQNRKYYLNKGVTANLGYLPTDSFTKGLVLGGTYTHYFSDFTAWEVVNANYVLNIETDLQKQLQEFQVQASQIPDFPQYYFTSNIVYTPFYNKSLLFNKSVVWGETSFLAGLGVANYKRNGITPLISGGLNLRYFTSPSSSLKLDIREIVAFVGGNDGIQAILYIGLGYTFQLGSDKRAEVMTNPVDSGDNLEKYF